MFFLALALLGPGLFGLAWDTDTPGTIDKWLLVSSAALYLAAAVTIIAWRMEPRPVIVWRRSPPTRDRKRFALALTFSLFIHALIISLQFGVPGIGLPGLALPWAERRLQASDLTVRLVDATPRAPPVALRLSKELEAVPPPVRIAEPRRKDPDRKTRPEPRPKVLAQSAPQPFKVPPPKRAEAVQQPAPQIAEEIPEEPVPAVQAAEQPGRQAEEAARQRAEEHARRESDELVRRRALALQKEQEAKRIEEARKQEEAAIQEEIKKQEEARRLALEVEALKRAEDAARQQAIARQKELEAKRQAEEAAARAKEAAERQRAEADAAAQRERLATAPGPGAAPAPGAPSRSEIAAKALDQIRKSGPTRAESLAAPPIAEKPRRRSILGTERDVPLRMYVESWRSKIERNGALNYRPSASQRAQQNPIATVSIRSDGSLENVWINQSSGVRELDQAVLNIARLYAPYSKFPPALASQYDVLEIRREWSFDNTLRLLDATVGN